MKKQNRMYTMQYPAGSTKGIKQTYPGIKIKDTKKVSTGGFTEKIFTGPKSEMYGFARELDEGEGISTKSKYSYTKMIQKVAKKGKK